MAGLRERKKLETHRAIVDAARELVRARGLDGVTIDEIAATAGVSPRTFFNYFPCKEEAVVGLDPGVLAEVTDELRRRPAEESPIDALHAVLAGVTDPHETLRRWQLRSELVRQHPELLPRHLAAMTRVESALADTLAERLGTDPEQDPTARLLVAVVLGAARAAVAWWEESDGSTDLASVLDAAFDLLAPLRRGKP